MPQQCAGQPLAAATACVVFIGEQRIAQLAWVPVRGDCLGSKYSSSVAARMRFAPQDRDHIAYLRNLSERESGMK